MRILNPGVNVIGHTNPITAVKFIERIARKCYKSEDKIVEGSYKKFIIKLIESGHESTIEHMALTLDIVTDRGVSHEMVRHRISAVSQESTRYANYANDKFGNSIIVIKPFFFDPMEPVKDVEFPNIISTSTIDNPDKPVFSKKNITYKMNSFDVWYLTCLWCEWGYMTLINDFNRTPQEARSVLPNSTKTEFAITANFREMRHIFKLRALGTAGTPHPQMRQIMLPALKQAADNIPIIFDDIYKQAIDKGLYNTDNKNTFSKFEILGVE